MQKQILRPFSLCTSLLIFASACSDTAGPKTAAGTSASALAGSDVVVTGQLAVSNLPATVSGADGLTLGQQQVKIKDSSGNAVVTTQTASDGSYAVTIPGGLVVSTTSLALADPGLSLETVIADTADKSVVGIRAPLSLDKAQGRVLAMGKSELAKITAIRGQVTLEGARDHTGISVYVPGTSYAARTDAAGMYLMTFIPTGSYELRMEKDGFTSLDAPPIEVTEANTTIAPAASLRIGSGTGFFSVRQVGTEGLSNSRTVSFNLTAGNADRYRVGTPSEVQTQAYKPIVSQFSYTFDSDGEKQLEMVFATADGFESTLSKTIQVDTVAPSASQLRLTDPSNLNTAFSRSPQLLVYHASCEDIADVAIVAQGTAPKTTDFTQRCFTGVTNSEALPRVPTGTTTYAYDIWARDAVGTLSATPYSGTIVFDPDAPDVAAFTVVDPTTLSAAATNELTVQVTVSNCTAAGIDKIFISESQNTAPAASVFDRACAGTHNYRFANDIEELKRVFVWGIDTAGNVARSAQSHVILLDTTSPAAPAFIPADPTPASPSASPPQSNTSSLVASSISCSGVLDILLRDNGTARPSETDSGWTTCASTINPVTAAGSGLRTLYLWSKDGAGNVSTNASTQTINVKLTPSSAPTLQLLDPNTSDVNLTNATTVNVGIAACDSHSKVYFAQTASPAPLEADFVTSCSPSGLQTSVAAGDGSKTIYMWYRDEAGNVSSAASSASITLDQTAPLVPALSLAVSDTTSGSSTYTNDTAIAYVVGNCPAAAYYSVVEGVSSPSAFAGTWVACASPSSTTSISSGNGLKTVSVWVKDLAGNINSTYASTTITLDMSSPSAPTFSLADASGSSDAGFTQSLSSSATLQAGSCSDLTHVLFNLSGTSPGEATSGWQSCSTAAAAYSVNLTGASPGSKTAYIWGKDAAGNISGTGQASIYYDTSAPVISNVKVTAITTNSLTIEWDTDEEASSKVLIGTSPATYNLTAYNASAERLTHHTATISGLTEKTKYYYKVASTDKARLEVTGSVEYSAQTFAVTPFYHTTNSSRLGGYASVFNNVEKKPMVACDLNSDGRDDLVVAAPDASVSSYGGAGTVYVFFGVTTPAASYLAPTNANISYVRNIANYYLGIQVRCLDFNGDGNKDLLISEKGSNTAFIVHGGSGITTGLNQDIATARSVQIVPASGVSSFTSIATGNFRGPTDAFDDVVVCNASTDECQIYFGAATPTVSQTSPGAIWKCGDCTSSNFGSGAFAGDFDGDGLLDLAVGDYYSNGEDGLTSYAGGFYIRKGGSLPSSGTQTLTVATQANYNYAVFGPAGSNITMGWSGDIDGDSYDDILIRPYGEGESTVYVVFGRPASGVAGTSPPNDWADDPYVSLSSTSLRFSSVGAGQQDAGRWASGMIQIDDVNLDGKEDILVGNSNASSYQGQACLFLGRSQADWSSIGSSITLSEADLCFVGPDTNNYLGTSVAIGNFNGASDLKKELFIGAMGGKGASDLGGSNGEAIIINLEVPSNRPSASPINYNLGPILTH